MLSSQQKQFIIEVFEYELDKAKHEYLGLSNFAKLTMEAIIDDLKNDWPHYKH